MECMAYYSRLPKMVNAGCLCNVTMLVSVFPSSFTFYETRGLWSLLFRLKQVLLMAREVVFEVVTCTLLLEKCS